MALQGGMEGQPLAELCEAGFYCQWWKRCRKEAQRVQSKKTVQPDSENSPSASKEQPPPNWGWGGQEWRRDGRSPDGFSCGSWGGMKRSWSSRFLAGNLEDVGFPLLQQITVREPACRSWRGSIGVNSWGLLLCFCLGIKMTRGVSPPFSLSPSCC